MLKPNPTARRTHRPAIGFTIVELLVVIAILSVLIGLLMPALSGVKRRSLKTSEFNSLKQIAYAWQMYATHNNDAALPGYLDAPVQNASVPGVQKGWNVSYQFQDRSRIPNAPVNLPGPWTWRLLSYLDYNHVMVHGHLDEEGGQFSMQDEAQEIAEEPGFGYNGLYVGGYWTIIGSAPAHPQFRFYNHRGVANQRSLTVPLGVSQIHRSSDMVLFCSSTKVASGSTPAVHSSKMPNDTPGWHLVTPSVVGTEMQWEPDPREPMSSALIPTGAATFPGEVYVPFGRYTGAASVLHADGHTENLGYSVLHDQRKWINSADDKAYTHAAP